MSRKKFTIMFVVTSLILFIVFLYYNLLDFYVLILLNAAIILYLLSKNGNFKLLLLIFVQWLIYFPLLLVHKFITPMIGSGDDDLRFEVLAKSFYNSYVYGTAVNVFQESTTYPKFLALFYSIGKDHELTAGLINITVHSVIIILIYKIYILVFENSKGAILTATLFTIYPVTMFNTVLTLREIIITLFVVLFVYFLLKYHTERNIVHLFISLLVIGIGSLFHIGLIALFVATGVYFLLFSDMSKFGKVMIGVTSLLIVVAFVLTTSNSKITSTLGGGESQPTNEIRSTARADYITPQESVSISGKAKQIVYFVTKPFPWEVRNFSDITGFFNIFFILLSFIIAIDVYRKTNNRKILIILIVVFISYGLFAFGTYNYGTALRHRDKYSLLLMMFISYYLVNRKKEKNYVSKT
ncbi:MULTISPECIES: glycosyltransferase family 39 protein [Staphylococcus]|uniref:glycosyltransferase family 39 protein n=1 Tax=Staphylococcus TaxID=1279 RepID=UPI000CD2C743|nr:MULTISPECIES: glycosyltransferase family 39 protein [Staphylococcus]MBO0387403.1 glycosyltransferase family 39 protein [Staphylococcus simulans]MBU6942453.1 glycosyltransferase family 39 protein [Staphylococcus sp. CWZ226]MDQ7115505.1 glycosyltransferase family 39 protein [Staphylococcus simulans]MDQ7140828.1 glycosyltransferase family 39 protein [Staphylococcus simulans]PNZ45383.1 hypothetical protein CD112_03230 [Staphylococcus simulans]